MNYIIYIPDELGPVQLLETGKPGMDPFSESYPKGIIVNPCDFIVYNWDYSEQTPDFHAIVKLFVFRESGEAYTADPETKTYAVEISKQTYGFAQKRLAEIRAHGDSDDEAEEDLLSDIVEAYYRDHEKYVVNPEDHIWMVGPSRISEVNEYWARVKMHNLLEPEYNEIRAQVAKMGLSEHEAKKRVDELYDKAVEESQRDHIIENPDGTYTFNIGNE